MALFYSRLSFRHRQRTNVIWRVMGEIGTSNLRQSKVVLYGKLSRDVFMRQTSLHTRVPEISAGGQIAKHQVNDRRIRMLANCEPWIIFWIWNWRSQKDKKTERRKTSKESETWSVPYSTELQRMTNTATSWQSVLLFSTTYVKQSEDRIPSSCQL